MKIRKWLPSSVFIFLPSPCDLTHDATAYCTLTTQLSLSLSLSTFFTSFTPQYNTTWEDTRFTSIVTNNDAIIFFLLLHNPSMLLLLRYCFFWWPFCLLWLDCFLHNTLPSWSQTAGFFFASYLLALHTIKYDLIFLHNNSFATM
jgi:hypothetical protein